MSNLNILNKYFNTNIKLDFNNDLILDNFNAYLEEYIKDKEIEYNNKVCVILKSKDNTISLYALNNKNNIIVEDLGENYRKYLDIIDKKYELKISNINLSLNNLIYYPLVKNYLFGNDTHYINKDLPFSINNYNIFLTKWFYEYYKKEIKLFNYLRFSTDMLFKIEEGIVLDNYSYLPIINVVNNGRWYYSNSLSIGKKDIGNIHNNLDNRNKLENLLNNNGYTINIDIISAVPYMFSKITKSKQLQKLIDCRLENMDNKELKHSIKDLTNIYIFSNYNFDRLKEYYNNKIDFSLIKKKLNITSLHDFFNELQKEINIYDESIINKYKKNLNNKQLLRNICLPEILFDSKKEFIKKHRVYINGHVNDVIVKIAQKIYEKYNIYPIYTIYDNLMYYSKNKKIINNIYSLLTKLKIPANIVKY